MDLDLEMLARYPTSLELVQEPGVRKKNLVVWEQQGDNPRELLGRLPVVVPPGQLPLWTPFRKAFHPPGERHLAFTSLHPGRLSLLELPSLREFSCLEDPLLAGMDQVIVPAGNYYQPTMIEGEVEDIETPLNAALAFMILRQSFSQRWGRIWCLDLSELFSAGPEGLFHAEPLPVPVEVPVGLSLESLAQYFDLGDWDPQEGVVRVSGRIGCSTCSKERTSADDESSSRRLRARCLPPTPAAP